MPKKIITILFLIPLILLLIMMGVNEPMGEPASQYSAEICTRYCHDRGESHTDKNSWVREPFSWTVNALMNNSLRLSYVEINILIFVVVWPLIMFVLLIVVLKNYFTIKKLKHG